MTALDKIAASIGHDVASKPWRAFRRDNPGIAPLVAAYLTGGPRPADSALVGTSGQSNEYALGRVYAEDARRLLDLPAPDADRGVGFTRFSDGAPPPSHQNDYDLLTVSWNGATQAAALDPPSLHYMSAVTCIDSAHHYGVPLPRARALNAILKDAQGVELSNAQYGGKLADPGSVAYQQEWCATVEARLRATGVNGIWIDDFIRHPSGLSGGPMPAKYPGPTNAPNPAWEAANVAFAKAIYEHFSARGFFVAWNAGGFISDFADSNTAQSTFDWWMKIIDYADALCAEMWMWHKSIRSNFPATLGLRYAGAGWHQQWEDWLRLPALCEARGVQFQTLHYATSDAHADYQLASMLLETDKGVCSWKVAAADDGMRDPWHATYDRLPLGSALGPKTRSGDWLERTFPQGRVRVNPSAGVAEIV